MLPTYKFLRLFTNNAEKMAVGRLKYSAKGIEKIKIKWKKDIRKHLISKQIKI